MENQNGSNSRPASGQQQQPPPEDNPPPVEKQPSGVVEENQPKPETPVNNQDGAPQEEEKPQEAPVEAEAQPEEPVDGQVVADGNVSAEGAVQAEGEEPKVDGQVDGEVNGEEAKVDGEVDGQVDGQPAEAEIESPEVLQKKEEFELESDPCIAYIKDKVELDKFSSEMWTIDHSRLIRSYLTDPDFTKLFFWVDETGLRYSKSEPPVLTADEYDTEFLYLIKAVSDDTPINMNNIQATISYGIVGLEDLKYLLKVMKNQFIPAFLSESDWPENVKKDFISQMHKFMASITETAFQREQIIKLYIPNEDLSDKQAIAQDKDLIQRLESVLLQWNKRIKEIVNNQEIQNDSELAGPLDEIEYWKSRQKNLSLLNEQLNSQELKKIVEVLQGTDSTYLKGFQNLANQINEGYLEAEDNLKYLKSLQEPCRKLEESAPKDIPEILPQLLQRVRMISEYSKFYNTKDRIAGLLRKISNEIIKRCKAQINLKELLEGDVEKCMEDLNDSINCGNKWRTIYSKMEDLVKKKSKGKGVWDFNHKSIFAQIDAFVQRCLDLKEICEGQLQFARKGGDSQMPIFGGTKGREIISLLEENRVRFKKLLDKIKDSDQDLILDIKSTKWHDDYNNFKNGMKDLDNMYESIINHAFESIATLEQGVEMLEAFDSLARRSSIKQSVQNKAQFIFGLFDAEITKAKQEFDNMLNHPESFKFTYGKHSGKALWVRSMLNRLDRLRVSIEKLNFIGENDMKKDCMKNHEQVYTLFKTYLKDEFTIWKEEVSNFDAKALEDCLQNPVLIRALTTQEGKKQANKPSQLVEKYKPKEDQLENNFDKQLMRLIAEASGWARFSNQFTHLGIIMPEQIRDFVNIKRENLRIYREQVMRVVREYNQIIDEMEEPISSIETKKLFEEHLKDTNRALEAGLKRIRFSVKSEMVLEGQVNDWLRNCRDLHSKLKTFRANTSQIHKKCKEISELQFIDLDKRNAIELTNFEENQERCRKKVSTSLKNIFEEIKKILDETYQFFYKQSDKIQTLWFRYVTFIDQEIEKSLKKAIRLSLVELNKTLNGDSKTEATPIFKVSVVLVNGNPSFNPNTDTLQETVRQTIAAITEITNSLQKMEQHMLEIRKKKDEAERAAREANQAKIGVRRDSAIEGARPLPEEITKKKVKSFYDSISGDREIDEWTNKILLELNKSCKGLNDLLNPWHKDTLKFKDKSEKRFAHSMVYDRNEPLGILASELETFDKLQSDIQENQKSTEKHHCIQLDNTIIKAQIIDKLILLQNTLLSTMQEKALQELNHLFNIVQSSAAALGPYPYELSQLRMNIEVWEEWTKKKPLFEVDLNELEEKFKFLVEKYGLQLKKEDAEKRDQLRKEWANFIGLLDEIQQRNAKRFADMKNETIKSHEEFNKESDDMRSRTFTENAPYTATNVTNERAFILLNEYKDQVRQLRKKEDEMKPAFALFKMSPAPNADLDFVDKEIQNLEQVWGLKEEWDQKWERELKKIKFKEIDTDQLEEAVDDFRSRIEGYTKEIRKWDVVKYLWDVLDQFLKTLPLINKLKHPSMRLRHWNMLKTALGRGDLDHEHDSFNLGEVYNLKLNQYPDTVESITDAARAQFQIEHTLESIKKQWETQEIDIERYKKDYFKIKKPEEIFTLLEEHMVTLAGMKTNTYFYVFENQIVDWENTLTKMLETLELLMTVQRQWIYLNSIFESQKDGKAKQLIGDNSRFKAQTKHFIGHLDRINNDRNALKSLVYDRFAMELKEISKNLEEIQKILLQLLEMKRKDFPRFYFLSNDDLFELLGNSRDPFVVNKHIKKLFEGIKALDISVQHLPKGVKQEIVGMISPEGERVEFTKSVLVDNEVDRWLTQVQDTMKVTLKVILLKVTEASNKPKETKWIPAWVQNFPGQLLLLALQMRWTKMCADALNRIYGKITDKTKAWQPFRQEQRRVFEELTKLVRKVTNDNDRLKLVAMITVMIHMKDVVDNKLVKNCTSPNAFEWQSQLRFEEVTEGSEAVNCRVEQMSFVQDHGFEYQGNNGRLVVTNLTDRCYLTLTTAMRLTRGGAPQGPAGTGKTETVKDLGKAMGKFVLVFNCSEGLEYSSLGRMFSGLVQTGSWGCFDEFNRIEVEVLSVIATQISTIFQALRLYPDGKQSFFFETHEIGIDPTCGIFITMNPGYAGRSELPDNLKSLFRPMSMVVPNSDVIAHTLLSAEGFTCGEKLSKKVITLYDLMIKQLSKQDHYDFGLRAVKSVLTAAGRYRRTQGSGEEKKDKDKEKAVQLDFQLSEDERLETLILMRAIRDMNLPKFVAEDIPLFNALFNVIFQVSEMPTDFNETLQNAIYDVMTEDGYQQHPPMVTKIIQLNESKDTRHGNMLVGSALSGKSTCWKILQKALNKLSKTNAKKFPAVRITHLNPKAVDIKELYGYVDPNTSEWYEGVLSCQMAAICKEESADHRWMILDGPVDTIWIESMNTVLDDNKVLTLLNGDRIGLPSEVGLIFEVENLSAASPATVSRCGMVYMDINELGWRPYVDSWIDKKKDPELRAYLDELFYKWIKSLLDTKRKFCKELVPASSVNLVISLCKLLDALNATEASIKFDDPPKTDEYWLLLEKWFAFALLWSVGATVTEDGRKIIDSKFRDIESFFPSNNVYDYYINSEKNDWAPWEEKLSNIWKPPAGTPFHKLIVPTVDTYRNRYVLQVLLKSKNLILVVGQTGTGKTSIINSLLSTLDESYTSFYINFSAQTTSVKTQEIIESKLVRRSKAKMTPDAGKRGIIFIDDLNMPRKDEYGSQPPLELIRQHIEYGGWYDRQSLDIFKLIDNVQFLAAMGPPGGGRAEISQRLQSKFNTINFVFPSDAQIKRIFQSILSSQLNNLDEEFRPLTDPLASATINLYQAIQATFLPTPAKAHYVFNMRDISKVIQGVCRLEYCDTKPSLIKVWVHECLRVFYDRMVNEEDRAQLKRLIADRLELELGSNLKECNAEEEDLVFVDFLDEDNQSYQEVKERERLSTVVKAKLDNHNETVRGVNLNIVMFKEAILNVCKIHRIIKLSRGHALLIGEGGAGRHSLTRLAAFIAGFKVFQIKITKNYENRQFREDLKKFFEEVGTRRTPGVFIFSDNEIIQESFVEDVNSLISSGEVPNLFKKEEMAAIRDKCRKDAKTQKIETEEGIWEFFLNRVQSNLHVTICMSKTGDNLRNYTRMYPGLINNTTMIWFMPWPQEALFEVANHYLATLADINADSKKAMAGFFSDTHTQVLGFANKMWLELKRLYYVTASNYIELVQGYLDLLKDKRKEVGNDINKLNLGLEKLAEAGRSMEELSVLLDHAHNDLTQKQKDCEELMIRITHENREADEKQKEVEAKKVILEKDRIETENLANSAKADLDAAMPALLEASEKIDKLTNSEFAEIKAYSTPPEPVMAVMSVILIFLGKVKDVSWPAVKATLSDPNFVSNLKEFSQKEKDNISTRTLNKVEKYTSRPDMTPGDVRKISAAAGALWDWCIAMEKYAKAWRDIEPKRNNVRKLEDKLKKNEDELRLLEEKYLALKAEVDRLKSRYEQANDDKEKFKNDAHELRIKLERAEKLVYSLSSSKERWASDKRRLLEQYDNLIGDALLSAAFLSYSGPFPSEYRERLINTVMLPYIRTMKIPYTRNYSFSDFLAKPTDIQKWNHQGLPTDQFSIENGVIVVKSRRWPLMIDPQMQANKWIKSMEKEKLILLDLQTENYMSKIERAIFDGHPVLLQNIGEDLDPSLDPILTKSLKQIADKLILVIGDREIGYNPNFRLYMTTKFSNPKYKAEVSTKVTLVNFTVKEKGLEEQLLGKLIENLEPELEKRKNELVQKTAKNQAKLKESDDEVLRLLVETKGSLVDDDSLVVKLQNSKATEDEIKTQIESGSQTMKKTLALRENYRPLGTMASHLFFVLNDLNKIDHMYQFSLESYIDLFINAIPKKEERHMMLDTLQSKLDTISDRHKIGVYKYACRSLFEKDKILLSMQMTAKLSSNVNTEEYNFFLRGIGNVDRTQQPPNPAPEWLNPGAWDSINVLDKLAKFDGLIGSFMNSTKEWRRWYMSEAPETEVLPGEWSNRFDTPLRMMILLKALRPDRVMLACREFVINGLGEKFITPPDVNFDNVHTDSKPSTPIVIILSPGVDPYPQIEALAQRQKTVLYSLSLGQGQSDRAKDKIMDGVKNGHWVFLANCHLSISFLADLEKLLEKLKIDEIDPNSKFRLWLTTNPHPKFSISILQRSIKVTTEPPRGIKANMLRLYTQMQEDQFKVEDRKSYKKMLFCLCWFHSVIIERKRFKSLGWNISYDFNDSDFQICENIIKNYLDKSAKGIEEGSKIIPWDAIRYLIYEINYGGRVTDECDRTLLKVYANEFFNERILEEEYNLADPNLEFKYLIPDDEGWKPPQDKGKEFQFKSATAYFYETEIRKYPDIDPPGAFGQHINAVISSQITDTNILIESILSLQPRDTAQGAVSMEEVVEKIVNDLKDRVPEVIPLEEVEERNKNIPDDDPYKIVMKQEIARYNKLLVTLEASLKNLLDGIKGRILISEDLEKIMQSLYESRVPRAWKFAYPSLKPLNSWIVDLNARVKEMRDWALKGQPMVFWISSFTYPKGFLTAILQQTARKLPKVSIDMLGLDFYFLNTDNVNKAATDGVFVQGLYLEGAKWDWNKSILVDADPMTLHYKMPVMQFRPVIVEGKKAKKGQSLYSCPTYMYPVRGDASFVLSINLPCGTLTESSFWVKRGAALLMSLGD